MRGQPPGPKGYPVVGNAYHYSRDPFAFLEACGRAYRGHDIVALDFGGRRSFMVTDPDAIRSVLVTAADRYRKTVVRDDAVVDLLGDGLLLSEGETWRERRTLAQPAFGAERLERIAATMVERAEAMVDGWRPGDTVDLHDELPRLTLRIVVDAMFGADLSASTARRIQAALEPLGDRFQPDFRRILVPRWLPTRENRQFREALDAIEAVLDGIVADRRRAGVEGDDLLAVLLRALSDPARDFDRDDLRDELVTMLLAGHDTTALALVYGFYLLSGHPDADARLAAELDAALDGPPAYDDLPALEHTERVLSEAMRLYPPVYALFREPAVDVRLCGYRVPAGSVVVLPQWVVHRDPRWYDDPEAFDPDRFAPDRAAGRPPFAYFPFGGGPRGCIGRRFSLIEGQLVLAAVARRYRLEYVGDEPLPLRGSLTMHPDGPVPVTVRER